MLFNSVVYWLFLPLVWLSYFLLPIKQRWIWLLLVSYFFYGFWKVEFAGLMLLTSVIDWWCGMRVEQD
ncbi:MAG: MBOAT family protein, partial [Bacteroidota bacterium]